MDKKQWFSRTKRLKVIFLVILFSGFFSAIKLNAQQSVDHLVEYDSYREGLALFDKEKFGPAQEQFQRAMLRINDPASELHKDAMYLHAICAIELFHADAEALILNFIHQYPESKRIKQAYFNLAKFQFRKKRYKDVTEYLSKISVSDLNEDQKAEFHFKNGYSLFMEEQFDESANNFYEIIDTDNPYTNTARYYYAHISYEGGKYETAAQNFKKIENDPLFSPIVPYYFTQIFYLQGKYDQLLAYAPELLDSIKTDRSSEISRLVGDAYYKTNRFSEALPYLEKHMVGNPRSRYEDKYQLGYAYFKAGDCKKSIEWLQEAIGDNDTINQSAYYTLGECYMKTGNKRQSKTVFRTASESSINPDIREDALFNYAKLAYELSYHPYDDAILAFEEYINSYPKSTKIDDAYEYLVAVYYTTKNYKEALRSISRIKDKNYKLQEAEQRIAYYRGVELFNDGDYKQALALLEQSEKMPIDPTLIAQSVYWKADASFRLRDFDNAIGYFTEFLYLPKSIDLTYYNNAFYNIAYSFFNKKDFLSSIYWFRNFLSKEEDKKSKMRNDGFLRLADAYFIKSDYGKALESYEEAMKMGLIEMPYATYQAAIASGLQGDNEDKAELLKLLVDTYDNSDYTDDALAELAKTQLIFNNPDDALSNYQRLISDYPSSSYMSEALLKRGLIYYNKKQDDLALASFDKVITDYGSSRNAKEALERIRKIYVDKGDVTAFEEYISGVPFADISQSRLDSTTYEIAQNTYLSGDCKSATKNLTNYLAKYPKGIFALDAYYYRADCEYKNEFYNEALLDFGQVLSGPKNKFTENSLYTTAFIQRRLNDTTAAIQSFKELEKIAEKAQNRFEAQYNLMELLFMSSQYDESYAYASSVLSQEKLDAKIVEEVKLIQAQIDFSRENYDSAITTYTDVAKYANKRGAEAKFMVAKIRYLKGDYEGCEKMIYELVNQVPSYPKWIGKGFILLADNFLAKEDLFNAKVTLQSVIDNADDAELVQIAKEKLNIIIKTEKESQSTKINEPIIELNDGDEKDDKLFNDQDQIENEGGSDEK